MILVAEIWQVFSRVRVLLQYRFEGSLELCTLEQTVRPVKL